MNIGGYLAVIRIGAKFMRALSKAIAAEEARDGEVTLLDYLACVMDALLTMDEEDLNSIKALDSQR